MVILRLEVMPHVLLDSAFLTRMLDSHLFAYIPQSVNNGEVLQSEIHMQIFVKLGLRPYGSCGGPAKCLVVLQIESVRYRLTMTEVQVMPHGLNLQLLCELLTGLLT